MQDSSSSASFNRAQSEQSLAVHNLHVSVPNPKRGVAVNFLDIEYNGLSTAGDEPKVGISADSGVESGFGSSQFDAGADFTAESDRNSPRRERSTMSATTTPEIFDCFGPSLDAHSSTTGSVSCLRNDAILTDATNNATGIEGDAAVDIAYTANSSSASRQPSPMVGTAENTSAARDPPGTMPTESSPKPASNNRGDVYAQFARAVQRPASTPATGSPPPLSLDQQQEQLSASSALFSFQEVGLRQLSDHAVDMSVAPMGRMAMLTKEQGAGPVAAGNWSPSSLLPRNSSRARIDGGLEGADGSGSAADLLRHSVSPFYDGSSPQPPRQLSSNIRSGSGAVAELEGIWDDSGSIFNIGGTGGSRAVELSNLLQSFGGALSAPPLHRSPLYGARPQGSDGGARGNPVPSLHGRRTGVGPAEGGMGAPRDIGSDAMGGGSRGQLRRGAAPAPLGSSGGEPSRAGAAGGDCGAATGGGAGGGTGAEEAVVRSCAEILAGAMDHSLKAVELANTLRARVGTEVLALVRERWGGLLALLERQLALFRVDRIPKNDKVTLLPRLPMGDAANESDLDQWFRSYWAQNRRLLSPVSMPPGSISEPRGGMGRAGVGVGVEHDAVSQRMSTTPNGHQHKQRQHQFHPDCQLFDSSESRDNVGQQQRGTGGPFGYGQGGSQSQLATRCLHVGNVSAAMTELQLMREFQKFGQIDGLKLVSQRGGGRRFAFVTFHTVEQAVTARHCLSKQHPWKSAISFARKEFGGASSSGDRGFHSSNNSNGQQNYRNNQSYSGTGQDGYSEQQHDQSYYAHNFQQQSQQGHTNSWGAPYQQQQPAMQQHHLHSQQQQLFASVNMNDAAMGIHARQAHVFPGDHGGLGVLGGHGLSAPPHSGLSGVRGSIGMHSGSGGHYQALAAGVATAPTIPPSLLGGTAPSTAFLALGAQQPHMSHQSQQPQQQRFPRHVGSELGMDSLPAAGGSSGDSSDITGSVAVSTTAATTTALSQDCPVLRRLCDDCWVPTQPWPIDQTRDGLYCQAIVAQLAQFGGSTTVSKLRGFLRNRLAATDNIKSVPLKALLTAYAQMFHLEGNYVSLTPVVAAETLAAAPSTVTGTNGVIS